MDDEVREFLEQNDPVGEHYVPPKHHTDLKKFERPVHRWKQERDADRMRRAKKAKHAAAS